MMIKKIHIYVFLMLSTMLASAQSAPENTPQSVKAEDVELFYSSSYSGNVKIQQASNIAKLVGSRKAILKRQKGVEGYRIRIYAKGGAGARTSAQETRVEFQEKFKDIDAYLLYNAPNWEVHVGDFRSRIEAMQKLEEIKEEYAQAFIVKDIIEFPELNEE